MRHTKPCAQCSRPINRSGQGAVFCFPCANERTKVRIAPADRRRTGEFWRRKVGNQFVCVTCAAPVSISNVVRNFVGPRHCDECGRLHRYAKDVLSGRTMAARAIQHARADGRLTPLAGCACVDCGAPAVQYDHRDYNEPLKVEPVCRSCNVIRGPALPVIPAPLFSFLVEA
jgi:hypothetical protein